MSDNIGYTPGAGADVATDQASDGSHIQIVKLAQGGDGDKTPIPSGPAGLLVNASSRGLSASVGLELCTNQTPVPSVAGEGYIPANAARRSLVIQNNTSADLWIAGVADATSGYGLLLSPGQTLVIDKTPCSPWYIYADTTGVAAVNWLAEND